MSKKLPSLLFVFILLSSVSFGQSDIEMADVMRSNGKIYVVVAVAAVVMIGMLIYMVTIDKKVTDLEKKLSEKNKK